MLQRVRAGDLERRRLELASFLGSEAASRALGTPRKLEPDELALWTKELVGFGREATVRAGLAASNAALAVEGDDQDPDLPQGSEALPLIEEWVLCPCPEHAKGASYAGWLMDRQEGARAVIGLTARLVSLDQEQDEFLAEALEITVDLVGGDRTQEVVTTELRSWALGHGDPVRERHVPKRKDKARMTHT